MAATLNDYVVITGIPLPDDHDVKVRTKDNGVPYATNLPRRYELTKWFEAAIKSSKQTHELTPERMQWTLFVLGLELFKSMPVEDKRSYFQIAGIHGYPQTSWDGVEAPKQKFDDRPPPGQKNVPPGLNPHGGYCHHNTIAFPTWHRPYVLLYEQLIWENMNKIIDSWTKETKDAPPKLTKDEAKPWIKAAQSWRMPYWDFGHPQSYPKDTLDYVGGYNDFGMPYVCFLPEVPVYLPDGVYELYKNPLVNFENPEKEKNNPQRPRMFGDMPKEPVDKTKWQLRDYIRGVVTDEPETLPWSKCRATSRWGITQDPVSKEYTGLDGLDDYISLNEQYKNLKNDQFYSPRPGEKRMPDSLSDAVGRMFQKNYHKTWAAFASTKFFKELAPGDQDTTGYLSLEYIHNNIHVRTGGANLDPNLKKAGVRPVFPQISGLGHMSNVPVAAFDPIFWFHHCNCDRLFAIWQALNWEKWFDQEDSPGKVPDVKLTEALLPFRKDSTEEGFYDSASARNWVKLNYCYDDMEPTGDAVDGDELNEEIYKRQLAEHVKELYPVASRKVVQMLADDTINNETFFGTTTSVAFASREPNTTRFNDYIINIKYDRYALRGDGYTIRFFLTPGKEIDNIMGGATYLADMVSFGGVTPSTVEVPGCANCAVQNDSSTFSRAQIPITLELLDRARDVGYTALQSYQASEVESFLAEHLKWKFLDDGGKVLPEGLFPNTLVSVFIGTAKPDDVSEDLLPSIFTSSAYRPLFAATETETYGLRADM